jgi:hypothetical protein
LLICLAKIIFLEVINIMAKSVRSNRSRIKTSKASKTTTFIPSAVTKSVGPILPPQSLKLFTQATPANPTVVAVKPQNTRVVSPVNTIVSKQAATIPSLTTRTFIK